MTPQRVQMTRKRPWRVEHPDAVIVARPSKWGNPFRAGGTTRVHPDGAVSVSTVEESVRLYRFWVEGTIEVPGVMRPGTAEVETLAGRDLACWCRPESPCHADVLLDLANRES